MWKNFPFFASLQFPSSTLDKHIGLVVSTRTSEVKRKINVNNSIEFSFRSISVFNLISRSELWSIARRHKSWRQNSFISFLSINFRQSKIRRFSIETESTWTHLVIFLSIKDNCDKIGKLYSATTTINNSLVAFLLSAVKAYIIHDRRETKAINFHAKVFFLIFFILFFSSSFSTLTCESDDVCWKVFISSLRTHPFGASITKNRGAKVKEDLHNIADNALSAHPPRAVSSLYAHKKCV